MADKATTILGAIQELSAPRRESYEQMTAADLKARNERAAAALAGEKPAGDAPAAGQAAAPPPVAAAPEGAKPAGEAPAAGASAEGGEKKGAPIFKGTSIVNEEHGVIMLVGALSDAVDHEKDAVDASWLVRSVHDFTGRGERTFKANHDTEIKATLVESVTGVPILKSGKRLPAGEHIPQDDPIVAVGLTVGEGEAVAWVVGIKPEDPAIVKAAKDGLIAGASWAGLGSRE